MNSDIQMYWFNLNIILSFMVLTHYGTVCQMRWNVQVGLHISQINFGDGLSQCAIVDTVGSEHWHVYNTSFVKMSSFHFISYQSKACSLCYLLF